MFCFRVKRRLYDLREGNLNPAQSEKLRQHLQKCAACAKAYREMQQILSLATHQEVPLPSSQFWVSFEQELAEKLAQQRVLPREIKLRPADLPRINFRPAFALATVFILFLAINFYLFGGLPTRGRLQAMADERLMNDIAVLEELTDEAVILEDEDNLLDELYLIEDLS